MFLPVPRRHKPALHWAVPALVSALVLASLVVSLGARHGSVAGNGMLLGWGTPPADILRQAQTPQAMGAAALRLFTSLFLHANWGHLLGNVAFLLIFGIPAERSMGSLRLLSLFLVGGALANLCAALLLHGHGLVVVGASGAVSAVIGAYLALFPGASLGVAIPLGVFVEFVRAPAALLIGVWVLLQVGLAMLTPGFAQIAWSAHAAGVGFGLLFAWLEHGAIARRLRRLQGY